MIPALGHPPHPFTPADDEFHALSDDWWETETVWFSFNVPERKMGGWFYGFVRPNMGVAGGGVFVWDPSGVNSYELPYYRYNFSQPIAEEPRSLRDFTFTNNYRVQTIEPLYRHHLTYADRDILSLDVEHQAIMEPHPFAHGVPPFDKTPHFDQTGHLTGEMTLLGEKIAIDSYSVRDRSWGPRLDHKSGRIGYCFATTNDGSATFCCFARPQKAGPDGLEPIEHGYFVKDGKRLQIVKGWRRVERDPTTNFPTVIELEAEDAEGRPLRARGVATSRMMLPNARGVSCYTLLEWTLNSANAWGEDQDVWRNDQWSAARRTQRGA